MPDWQEDVPIYREPKRTDHEPNPSDQLPKHNLRRERDRDSHSEVQAESAPRADKPGLEAVRAFPNNRP